MGTAVEHVHHGNGQGLCVCAANVVVQALAGGLGRSVCAGQGHAEDGVRAETGLVGGAVDLDEHLVNAGLIQDVQADHRLCDLAVYVLDSLGNALAQL